ncbi:MAG: hypothetical protein M3Q62_12785 [Actinomycetota bacterium]|nr:hypothetical protein [Actinomycetota bacterium]MDQ3498526.1 hypothetical protein [Actinomycetota bacterium]
MRASRFSTRFSFASGSVDAASSRPSARFLAATRLASQSVTQSGGVASEGGASREKEESDAVLAGMLAARAGALHREIREVHPHLVDSAALALAPESFGGAAGTLPGFRRTQLPAGGGDLRIRRERRDTLGCQPSTHTSLGVGPQCCRRSKAKSFAVH